MIQPLPASRRRCAGFTLLELTVACAVSGLVATAAYPSVSSALLKARRSDALVAMTQLQLAQERWRSNSGRYATLAELGLPATASGGNYRVTVADPTPAGYAALAQATGTQSADRSCRFMKLVLDDGAVVYSSGDTEATANDSATNRQCWKL